MDNQLDAIGFDQIDRVGAAFLHLIYPLNRQASSFQNVRRAVRGYEFESHVDEAMRDLHYVRHGGHSGRSWLGGLADRKSTPLNSSHQLLSYPPFFFQKK